MSEISYENLSLICKSFQSLQQLEVDNTKTYVQLILNFFGVVYIQRDIQLSKIR